MDGMNPLEAYLAGKVFPRYRGKEWQQHTIVACPDCGAPQYHSCLSDGGYRIPSGGHANRRKIAYALLAKRLRVERDG